MKFHFDRKFIIVAVVLIGVIASVYFFKMFKGMMTQKFISAAMPVQTVVTGEKVTEVFWEPQIPTVGTASAKQSVDIAPEVSGRVTEILFTSGQKVKEGELLIQLNPDVLIAELESAKAKAAFMAITYERQLELYKRNAGQKQSVDSALADMDEAKANVDKIQAQLDQLAIKAPFSGVLGLRYVNVGQYVSPGTGLVNLQSTNPMEINFTIPEVLLNMIKTGLKISVTSLAYPDEPFEGEIFAVNSQIEATSRGLAIRANVDNEKGYLLPDMFVEVIVHLEGGKKTISIPQIAMNYSQVGDFVYLVEDGKAVKHYVEPGERRGDHVAVESGLKSGDTIVTTGQLKLHDGSPIKLEAAPIDKKIKTENNKL